MDRFTAEKTFIVAELGINHNGRLKTAMDMVMAAKDCGADAVKLQVFTGEDFYWRSKEFLFGKSRQWKERVPHLFEDRKLTKEEIGELYDYCREIGIVCFSTPLSFQWLEFLESVDNPIYKISSGDVTCIPFVEEIARIGKPVILSTGKSKLSDVDAAVQTIQENNPCKLGILHCVAAYPTPLHEANLRLIQTYNVLYDCVPGFSDHTEGVIAPITAVALGARIIEKHFTLDKEDYGPDHWFSMDKPELKQLVTSVRAVEKTLGDGCKRLLKIEDASSTWGTRCIVAKGDMLPGHLVVKNDLDFKRPCFGLRPEFTEMIIGKKLKKGVRKNGPINFSDLAF